MNLKNGKSGRVLAVFTVAMMFVLGGRTATTRAAGVVVVADPAPDGVTLMLSASGEIEANSTSRLLLEGLFIGSCAVGEVRNEYGPTLVFADSYEVTIRFTNGDAVIDQLLTQGESRIVPVDTAFTLINGMNDSAFGAEVLLLSATDADQSSPTYVPIAPHIELVKHLAQWPEASSCNDVADNAKLRPTFKARGVAAEGATRLYLGIGIWAPGATTKGYLVSKGGNSFNLLLLDGGMGNAGFGTGRGFQAGPRQVLSDVDTDGTMSAPFTNVGSAPIVGIIFGMASGDSPVLSQVS